MKRLGTSYFSHARWLLAWEWYDVRNGAPWWLRPEQGRHVAGGVHVGKNILTLVRTAKISCSGVR